MTNNNKKPSERIKEIVGRMDKFLTPEVIAQSIMKYLDEEWEQERKFCPTHHTEHECEYNKPTDNDFKTDHYL